MNREEFIIRVYVMVCEQYEGLFGKGGVRQRGKKPGFSDEEVLTLEICGAYWGLQEEEALYGYFAAHWHHFFPMLPSRTTFVRQAANLWQVKRLMQQRLVQISGQRADEIQLIDTMPLPVCTYTRASRDRCFAGDADYGYCAAKQLHYYGFKLGLRLSRDGMILDYSLLPARSHDSLLLDDLIHGVEGIVLADKGFLDTARQARLPATRNVLLITPLRRNMHPPLPPLHSHLCRRWRKRIETVASHLTERFQIDHTRAHDLWHFQLRLLRKILAHTVCVFLNLLLHRHPLDLDDLVLF
jgi:Transposase DDE domain